MGTSIISEEDEMTGPCPIKKDNFQCIISVTGHISNPVYYKSIFSMYTESLYMSDYMIISVIRPYSGCKKSCRTQKKNFLVKHTSVNSTDCMRASVSVQAPF